MRKEPPRQPGIICMPLFDHARKRQRAQLSPAACRLTDRFGLMLEASASLAELGGLVPRNQS